MKDYLKRAEEVRLELMAMVDTIFKSREVMIHGYLKYFRNASPELVKQVMGFADGMPAWDILGMCLNHVGWRPDDYDVLIAVSLKFMKDVRTGIMEGKNAG